MRPQRTAPQHHPLPHSRRRHRRAVGTALAALLVLGAAPAQAMAGPTPRPVPGQTSAQTPAGTSTPTPTPSPSPASAQDLAVYGSGDLTGYHLYTASAAGGWAWHALATIQPGGGEDEKWIGQQCLTGDGRTVVAVVAPWSANNSEAGMDGGALAYAVDATTGAVRPLAADVSLAYYNPGCGAGGTVALTSYLGTGQRPTRVSVFDAASARLTQSATIGAELTSAVPAGGRILAAEGADLVDITSGSATLVHRFDGQLADLRADVDGGVDLTSAAAATTELWHYSAAAGARRLGSGPAATLTLLAGSQGRNIVADAGSLVTDSGLTALNAPGKLAPEAASSRGGLLQLPDTAAPAATATGADPDIAVWKPGTTAITRSALPKPDARRTQTIPSFSAATGTDTALAAPTAKADTTLASATPAAETSIPQCAVARNDVFKQVWQPGADQVRWAINQAALSALQPPDNSIARPTSNQEYALNDASYAALAQLYPSQAWPLQNLTPGSAPAVTVPPLVMYGILAQESNWDQASWHAVPGRSGNPLAADYYGDHNPNNPTGELDYDYSDCGYGIAQVTSGMQNPAYPGAQPTLPAAQQLTLAVDYASNIAYAEQLLQGKWQQLAALGLTMNNGDPTKVENWYAAIWGYNSGVYTGGPGAEGLGWFNNPANPMYPLNRHSFLHEGYTQTPGDASNPQQWPYQEKVFGWMEVPLSDGGVLDYRGTYDWDTATGGFLNTPPLDFFCSTSVNHCDPEQIGSADPCPAENSSCWWDAPVTWVADDCASSCVTDTPWDAPNNHLYYDTPGLPEPIDAPISVPCTPGANTPVTGSTGALLPGAVLVDDEAIPSQNPAHRTPNLMGCADPNSILVPPASANASFALLGPGDAPIDAAASPGQSAAIDLHQLGAGLGGQMFFTHTGSDPNAEARGRWQAQLASNTTTGTVYQVYAFIPDIGATTTHATYEIASSCANFACVGEGPVFNAENDQSFAARTINQSAYSDQWVSLGYYLCGGPIGTPPGPATCTMTVTLRSLTPNDDQSQGSDIAMDAVAFVPAPTDAYVVLGDSYSSGEGVAGSDGNLGGYLDGTDVSDTTPGDLDGNSGANGNGDLCHRSNESWPILLAAAKKLPVVDLACSGSDLGDLDGQEYWLNQSSSPATFGGLFKLPDLYTVTYHGDSAHPAGTLVSGPNPPASSGSDNWTSDLPNNEEAGSAWFGEPVYQLDLLRALRPRLVTLTLGGNDVGFADIITTCLSYSLPQLNEGCMADLGYTGTADAVDARIKSLEPMLASAYSQIATAAGGANRVTVVTYPAPLSYSSSQAPGSWDCTDLYAEDRQWLVPEVANLATVIGQAGAQAGVHVIDIHTLFDNNGPCASTPYVTAPDFNPFFLLNLTESEEDNWFHPNQAGYAAMEKAIAAKITIPAA